ncbi:MAG: hypothetical protein HYR97_03150 [Candidatus Melainabacteria bacterium]|nr:hypothetical protein [Candidatus Melainabacteria bacterium]
MQEVSAHSVIIDNPVTAVSEIDKALNTAIIYKKPVYIEIPRDMCEIEIQDTPYKEESKEIDQDALEEALNEAVKMLNKAKNPVILAGAEPARVGLQKELLSIAEKINAPVASTILGKSIFPEEHPLAMGVYFGQLSNSEVAEYINKSDCVLMLGVILSDINLGMFTAKADLDEAIAANIEGAKIKQHYYPQINLASFMNGLIKRTDIKKHTVDYPKIHIPNYPTGPENSNCILFKHGILYSGSYRCAESRT